MATTLGVCIANARTHLNETSAIFWTDAELLVHAAEGVKDLWKAIIDLQQGHFLTIDETHVSMAANTNTLTGVPTDVFRVELLEVRDLTTANAVQNLTFEARPINHPDVSSARGLSAQSPSGQTIFFSLFNAGAPVGAPSIEVAPQITSAVNLRLVYTPVLGTLTQWSTNPIPGESDHAVTAWIVAHALAKQSVDQVPDPNWFKVYNIDKRNLLTVLTPRQTMDVQLVEPLFESYW